MRLGNCEVKQREADLPSPTNARDTEAEAAFPAHLLLADEDEVFCRSLSDALGTRNARLTTASNPEDVLRQLRRRNYDLILVDLNFGDTGGLGLLPLILKHCPAAAVAALVRQGDVDAAVEAVKRGAEHVLLKQRGIPQLVHKISDILREKHTDTVGTDPGAGSVYGLHGRSPAMRNLINALEKMKLVDSTVLITGESGTGKELVARALHKGSARSLAPFVAINCGALPADLLESELFGHRKGAFTDARMDKIGLAQAADGGTLFLDEIGELPLNIQVKLLRLLQEREVLPIGATASLPVDVRIVAASNRPLRQMVRAGTFREDLYHRLSVLCLQVPPLRERREDIPELCRIFVDQFCQAFGKQVAYPSADLSSRLQSYAWPGNVRELQNTIERAVVLSRNGRLEAEDLFPQAELPQLPSAPPDTLLPIREAKRRFEKDYTIRLLSNAQGNVSQAARLGGCERIEIYRLIKRHGLSPKAFRSLV